MKDDWGKLAVAMIVGVLLGADVDPVWYFIGLIGTLGVIYVVPPVARALWEWTTTVVSFLRYELERRIR